MRIKLMAWLLPIVFISRKNEPVSDQIPVIVVDPTELSSPDILTLTDTILVDRLEVPDSIKVGRIRQIKQYGEELFLLSNGTYTSLLIFKGVDFASQFDQSGEGPGQYRDIYSFYIDIERREIVINDLRQKSILFYDLDSHDFKEKRIANGVFVNMEKMDSQSYLFAGDVEGEGALKYLQLADRKGDSLDIHLKTHYPLIRQAFQPNHFTPSGPSFYFSEPFTEVVYKISADKIEPQVQVDFGDYKFSSEYWESDSESQK